MKVLPILAPLLLLIGACASPEPLLMEYDAAVNQTIYQSQKVLVGNINMTGGLASGHRVMMQAYGACSGRDCKPDQIELIFYNDSSSDLNLDYRRVSITFGSKTLDWEDSSRINESVRTEVPRGEFTRVNISPSDFSGLAASRNVEILFGLTGTTTLHMPFDRREPLREMAERIGA